MFAKIFAFSLVLEVIFCQGTDNKVDIGVYYESLCPDSAKFISKQLHPTLKGELGQYVNLKLVPYGKSHYTSVLQSYEFECHHGVDECKGNKLHACAINLIQPIVAVGFNNITLDYITCLMERVDKSNTPVEFPAKSCAEDFNVNNLLSITNCAAHSDGASYLVNYATETEKIQATLESVPTIVINNKYDRDVSKSAFDDLSKVICDNIKEKPDICSSAPAFVASIFLLLISVYTLQFF